LSRSTVDRPTAQSLRYWLVMPAAGTGSRFGSTTPKQYLPLAGRSVIEWSLALYVADPRCQGMMVALAPGDQQFARLACAAAPGMRTVTGGATRAESVLNVLQAMAVGAQDWVLVHDAARPCLSRKELDDLLEGAGEDPVGGLLAVPLADTLKRADASLRTADTPVRDHLWRALTPQMFRAGTLRDALLAARAAGRHPTDEAQALEWCGQAARLVRGSAGNIKITEPADLVIAAAILQQRVA
jgi:2-C-methyl-D-erythritol 4-phosphate cytidylyltransferase